MVVGVGELVLLTVMLCIVKSVDNYDLSAMGYDRARAHLVKVAKEIPETQLLHAILCANANSQELGELIQETSHELSH